MEDNQYSTALNNILGSPIKSRPDIQSPERDMEELYDDKMEQAPSGISSIIQSAQEPSLTDSLMFDQYAEGVAAGEMGDQLYGGLEAASQGPVPNQQIVDPRSIIGSTGQRVSRGLKAGWGDLVYGTGETLDYLNAWLTPGESDRSSRVGDWMKKVGTEYQVDNALVLSEDLQDMQWDDIFKQEFWSSKMSRMLPYTLSFLVPYTGGAKLGGLLLGKFGAKAFKGMSKMGLGTPRKGITKVGSKITDMGKASVGGKGLVGKLAIDAGKKGIQPTKLARDWSGYLGGGFLANLAEGTYLAGEAYSEMANETDADGNYMFTPEEAASHAHGVVTDNGKWVGLDILQYGLLFGGLGRATGLTNRILAAQPMKANFGKGMKPLTQMLVRKVVPNLPNAAAYAGVEMLTEGLQETYQEWVKYKHIQRGKGLDYLPMTEWIRDSEGKVRPEIRDVFWSAAGLGMSMGGARGFFDAHAERTSMTNEKIDLIQSAMDGVKDPNLTENEQRERLRALLAFNIFNDNGDGSTALGMLDKMVKNGTVSPEVKDEFLPVIEEYEKNYNKHNVDTHLTEAGAEQAFITETNLGSVKKQQADAKQVYEAAVKKSKETIKDKTKLESTLKRLEQEYNKTIEPFLAREQELNTKLEDIYTLREEAPIAKATGKSDARYSKRGLSKEKIQEFSQEAQKKAAEEEAAKPAPTITERITEVGKQAVEGVKDIGTKAVEGVKGLFGKAKEKAESTEVKEAIEKIKNYDTKKITSGAKEKLIKAVEEGKILAKKALEIIGTGVNKVINNTDVKEAIKKKERQKTKEDTITPKIIKDSKKSKYAVTEEMQDKGKPIRSYTDAVAVDGVSYRFKIEEFEDGTVLYNVSEIASDDKGGMPIRSLTEKEYKSLVKKSQEDVKKKDKSKVVPKTEQYKQQEESIKDKPKTIKKARISKESGRTYSIKTEEGETIKYQDFEGTSDKYVLGEEKPDVELRLKKPVKGQPNVVIVNDKPYFQFRKNADLYESEIEVVAGDEVIGKVQQDKRIFEKGPEVKSKAKKATQDRFIDRAVGKAKGIKQTISQFVRSAAKILTPRKPTFGYDHNYRSYPMSGFSADALAREIVDKKFPGYNGYAVYTKLKDDYGSEATSLAFGSTVLINADSIKQTDAIHEAGHVYYGLMENTPLMKKIRKLLPKTILFSRTKAEYPELILLNYKGQPMTLGSIYRNIANNINRDPDLEGDIKSIVSQLSENEGVNDSRFNELLNELLIQLKSAKVKEIRVDRQKHLLEETFVRTLESYSYGTVDAVIKDTKTQELLKKDLLEFYKEIKNLTTDEEAKRFLDLSVDEVQNLNLEAAIKHVLLDFKSNERTAPKIRNSAYGDISRANKDGFRRVSNRSATYSYIARYTGRNLSPEQISNNVVKDMESDGLLKLDNKERKQVKDYIKAVYAQQNFSTELDRAEKRLDALLEERGRKKLKTEEQESEFNRYDDETKNTVLSSQTSNFFDKLIEIHNDKHPSRVMKKRELLSELLAMSKESMQDPYIFPEMIRENQNENIRSMLIILDSAYENNKGIAAKHLTNAKLLEIKAQLEGTNIETLSHNALEISLEKGSVKKEWKRWRSKSKTIEDVAINGISRHVKENSKEIIDGIAVIYNNLFIKDGNLKSDKELKDGVERYNAANRILDLLLDGNYGNLINKQELLNKPILFNNERVLLHNVLFDHKINRGKGYITFKNSAFIAYNPSTKKFGKTSGKFTAKAWDGKQAELKNILLEGLVASRAKNYLSMIDNVEQDAVSIFNKENSLHNRAKNIAQTIQNNLITDKGNFMHEDNNIYSHMLHEMKNDVVFQRGSFRTTMLANKDGNVEGHPFHFTVHSGLMSHLLKNDISSSANIERGKKLQSLYPIELMASDFFTFVSRYNQGIQEKRDRIIYDQPIAVFSDKSRRYYVESIAIHNNETRKLLLSKVKNNPEYNSTYKKGDRVFPFEIKNNEIVGINNMVDNFIGFIKENKDFFTNVEGVNINNINKKAVNNYLTSYIANRFMAQQFFVGDHSQAENEIDYMKRSAGAVAGHTVYDRNIMVEPIIIKDYQDENGAEENDAMGYVLPDQAEAIRTKYGSTQKVGNVFKFVYNYTELEGKHKGKTTYLKYAVHVITPKMEAENAYMKNMADIIRLRQENINKVSGNPSNLVMIASESAAKMFVGNKNYIYDISPDNFNINNINERQDELYMDGDADSQFRVFKGLSGEGLGIQLELDKQVEERFIPSQLFYNLVTNITNSEEQGIVDEMLSLRKDIMLTNRKSRAKVIETEEATLDEVLEERDSFSPSVTPQIYGNLLSSIYDYADPRYPYINASHNTVATAKITNSGTKLFTKGSVGYQSSSLGYDLKSYQKGLYDLNEEVEVSEAIVPGYLQNQGVNVGDIFIGTRIPSHGKVTSAVFVVKDFHDQIGTTPTSNITIPALVSKYWGSDLDGDAIYMNFKYNESILNPTEQEAIDGNWKVKSNRFINLYVDLLSKNRDNEIKVDIDFKDAAEEAIANSKREKDDQYSQLDPLGDMQMFADNDPSASLVGVIAALQRTFNVMSNSEESLPFKITIKGKGKAATQDKFFDNPSLENGVGNWFGVAQLLNIALDNAKWQYANKLGLDMQTVFPYVMLRRLGYSLNDLAVLFNSKAVKKYMEFRRAKSKDYISNDSEIRNMLNQKNTLSNNEALEFGKKYGIFIPLNTIIDKGEITVDLNTLNKKTGAGQAIAMLYALERYNKKVISPFSQAFTTHGSIEKNPIELNQIAEGINKSLIEPTFIPLIGNKKGLTYGPMSVKMQSNDIIDHANKLYDILLNRAINTDIRFTPYMNNILNEKVLNELDFLHRDIKNKVVNQIIINDLKQNIDILNNAKDKKTLVEEFENLKKLPIYKRNKFLQNTLAVRELKGGDKVIVIDNTYVNEYTSLKEIEQIRDEFFKLDSDAKDLIFNLEYRFNGFGLTGGFGSAQSFTPFFDKEYMESINKYIQTIIENNQKKPAIGNEYDVALAMVQNPKEKFDIRDEVVEQARNNNTFDIDQPGTKAKKKITPDMSYNSDYLGESIETLSFNEWVADKGIDLNKYPVASDTYKKLRKRYAVYLNHLDTVRKFETSLQENPLSNIKDIESLIDLANDFGSMDNSATKGIKHLIELEIGRRAFDNQVSFLKKEAKRQKWKYNVPGEDGVPQEDLGNFSKWLQSNNMTGKRPEIQYLNNEINRQYREYILAFKSYKDRIKSAHDKLYRSKMRGLNVLEKTKMMLSPNDKYRYIYGNLLNEDESGIRLIDSGSRPDLYDSLTQEEKNYYNIYKEVVNELINIQNVNGVIVPGMQMGNIESLSKNGMFGLYNNIIDSTDYNSVKVYGTNKNGKEELKTFYEWKYLVYKNRTKGFTTTTGKEINELEKLRKKAKELKQEGRHADNTKILLSETEYDALMNNGVLIKRLSGNKEYEQIDQEIYNEYSIRRSVRLENSSLDINTSLIEFIRGTLFKHGDGRDFAGMSRAAILTDAVIAFNKKIDNPNAVDYLTTWWKEGFIERQRRTSVFGKTGDKVIDGFVRLTSLRLLGFNLTVSMGNILAGKYQELRKRGGNQFIIGEGRFWKHWNKSRKILKDNRVIEYSFSDFEHLSGKKGMWGKIENVGYLFMDQSEHYIQGSAFLGMLTENEFNNPETITPKRAMEINHKIRTLHGEGYTAIDAAMLSMYSYGRALLQFKKWFITLLSDRLSPEYIDRFGEVRIGSYRAAGEYVKEIFDSFMRGDLKTKDLYEIYNKSNDARKQEMINYLNGLGIGIGLLSLIAILDDDDDPDTPVLKNLKKLSNDIFVTTDTKRFINYTIIPASFGTMKNASKMVGEAYRRDKIRRDGPKGKRGELKAISTAKYDLSPFGRVRYDLAKLLYSGKNKERSDTPVIR